MSFILDALKKSESDRQRQTGPALFEVKVAPPKARFPVWAVAIVALLVVNMMIVGWLLLRRSARADETAATNTPSVSTGNAAPAPMSGTAPGSNPAQQSPGGNPWPASAAGAPQAQPPGAAQPNIATVANGPPTPGASLALPSPAMAPASAPRDAALSSPPPGTQAQYSTPPGPQGAGNTAPRMPDRDQNEPTLAGNPRDPGAAGADSGASPDDYAPATDTGSPLFKGHVRRGTESGVMLYQDAAVVPGSDLPQLRLDLHVYAAKLQDRFALINMRRVHEGDTLQGGVKVESITPDGVVMSHNGSKFLLPRD